MTSDRKDITVKNRILIPCVAASALLELMVFAFRDDIVIYLRLFGYRALLGVFGAALAASGAALIFNCIKSLKAKPKAPKSEHHTPVLNVDGRLSPKQLQDNVESNLHKTGDEEIRKMLGLVLSTMRVMDELQQKLKTLLDDNGADALRDTEELLDHVEQHMCRNVRKLLNRMTILDERNSADRTTLLEEGVACAGNNQKLLELTKNFMNSLVDLLNRQGEQNCEEEISMYRDAITHQISQEEGAVRI